MTMRERLEDALYNKAAKEQQEYKGTLRKMQPDEIMNNAYRLIIQEDILMTFEDPKYLSDRELRALIKLDNVLESGYNDWLDRETSHMEDLRDNIADFAKGYADSLDAERKAKRKSEPER